MMMKILGVSILAAMPLMAVAESHEAADAAITGDADKGEKVFRKCKACHQVGDKAKNRVGPVLNGIIGRALASADGFNYSDALTGFAADNPTWTVEMLDAYLADPRGYIPGNKMSFAGLKKEDDRADVIAYLATFTE